MNRINHTAKYKKTSKIKAKKLLRRALKSKWKKKQRNILNNKEKLKSGRRRRKQYYQKKEFEYYDQNFKHWHAPKNFSLIENTEEVLEKFKELEILLKGNESVFVNLNKVENITNDAIVLLLSYIKTPRIKKEKQVRGNYPSNRRLRRIFLESGVFAKFSGDRNFLLTRQNKKADGKLAQDAIKWATSRIFGSEGRCTGIYMALMECMANTCYHAIPDKIAKETWWLTVYKNEERDCVSFAFLDLGVGIFKSSIVSNLKGLLSRLLGWSNNLDVLKDIISGNKISSTNISYRGKGLPSIYEGLTRNYYDNLKIISNDVKAEFTNDSETYSKLNSEFNGTFLYWELNINKSWIKL